MRVILLIILLACFSCEKSIEIQDPHFKELVGTWMTVSDTEIKTFIISSDGLLTIRHSSERGKNFTIDKFKYGNNKIIVNGDTLNDYACYDKVNSSSGIVFFKKSNVDSAYTSAGVKINNQLVEGDRSLFIKIK